MNLRVNDRIPHTSCRPARNPALQSLERAHATVLNHDVTTTDASQLSQRRNTCRGIKMHQQTDAHDRIERVFVEGQTRRVGLEELDLRKVALRHRHHGGRDITPNDLSEPFIDQQRRDTTRATRRVQDATAARQRSQRTPYGALLHEAICAAPWVTEPIAFIVLCLGLGLPVLSRGVNDLCVVPQEFSLLTKLDEALGHDVCHTPTRPRSTDRALAELGLKICRKTESV